MGGPPDRMPGTPEERLDAAEAEARVMRGRERELREEVLSEQRGRQELAGRLQRLERRYERLLTTLRRRRWPGARAGARDVEIDPLTADQRAALDWLTEQRSGRS